MTLVTISPGSKPKVALSASASAASADDPSCSSCLASHGITRSAQDLAEPLAKLGELDPALLAESDA